MLSRLDHEEDGQNFSTQLCEEIAEILTFVYGEKAAARSRTLEVYGTIYDTEIVLAVSLLSPDDESSTPVTYLASVEIEKGSRYEKVLDAIVDSAGLFLEQYFNDSEWDDYNGNWTEIEVKGITLFYLTSRENIKLTMMADELLRQQ